MVWSSASYKVFIDQFILETVTAILQCSKFTLKWGKKKKKVNVIVCFFCLFFSLQCFHFPPADIGTVISTALSCQDISGEPTMRPDSGKYLLLYKTSTGKKKGCLSGCGVSACESKLGATLLSFQIYHFQQASRGEASIRAAVAEITASQPTAASAGRSAAPRRDVLRARHRLQLFV